MSSIDPILNPENFRFTVYPIRYPTIWELYEKQLACFWKAKEIDFSKDYDDFLKSLNTKINIFKCNDESQIERIVQLSEKTNQFNFTHSRFDRIKVKKMLEDSSYTIYLASVSDNIGDSGIVLLLVTKNLTNDLSSVRIIEFVLSCRVFGRRIAEQTLDFIIRYLSSLGVQNLYCQFDKTSKNTQFIDFLPNLGFKTYLSGDSDYILSTLEYNSLYETSADIELNLP